MSLHRTVMRLAAVNALNNFLQAPYPTVAGQNIFDSQIVPVEDFVENVVFPICVVYTDYDKNHWRHASLNAGKTRLVTVTFELIMAQFTELPADDSGGDPVFALAQPNTDSELETSLDIFEMQIAEALMTATNSAAECFRYFVPKIEDVISRRGATVEGGQKIAARQITVESHTQREPAAGVVPQQIEAFLADLESHEIFRERASLIRTLYQNPASKTAAQRLVAISGYPTEVATKLGYDLGTPAMAPDEVVVVVEEEP